MHAGVIHVPASARQVVAVDAGVWLGTPVLVK